MQKRLPQPAHLREADVRRIQGRRKRFVPSNFILLLKPPIYELWSPNTHSGLNLIYRPFFFHFCCFDLGFNLNVVNLFIRYRVHQERLEVEIFNYFRFFKFIENE